MELDQILLTVDRMEWKIYIDDDRSASFSFQFIFSSISDYNLANGTKVLSIQSWLSSNFLHKLDPSEICMISTV